MTNLLMNTSLSSEIKKLIQAAKQSSAATVNAVITLLYWQVGKRIADEILKDNRGDYGQKVVAGLAKQLSAEFGRGWSKRNLTNMIKFSEIYPDYNIVQTLSAQYEFRTER